MIILTQLNNRIGGAEKQTGYLAGYLAKTGVPFRTLYVNKINGLFSSFSFFIGATRLLFASLRFSAKCVYVMIILAPNSFKDFIILTFPYLLVGLAITLLRRKFVLRLSPVGDFQRLRKFVPLRILKCFKYISITKQEYNVTLSSGLNLTQTVYVPNGVDIKVFRPKKQRAKKDFVFGFIGRFAPEKNLPLLIKAFKIFNRKNKISRLLLVGYEANCCCQCSKYIIQLRLLIKRLGLSKKVFLKPAVINNFELVRIYNDFDIFVYPSFSEGTANSVLEAMSCDKPTIVFQDCLGLKEIVNSCSGYTFSDPTPKSLAKTMEDAYDEIIAGKSKKYPRSNLIRADLAIEKSLRKSVNFLLS